MSQRKQSTSNGIKPLNLRMAPNHTARKLNRDGEQFLSGDGLPRDSGDDANGARTAGRWRNSPNATGFGGTQDPGSTNQRKTARAGRMLGKFRSTARSNADSELAARPYVKPWNQVHVQAPYEGSVGYHEQPLTKLAAADYEKRLRFEELKRMRLEAMCQWKQKDVKGTKKNAYIKQLQKKNSQILKIAEKSELEKLDVYTDRFPLLAARKAVNKSYLLVKLICFEIINTKLFDNISLFVIIVNSLVMTVDDSAVNDNPNPIWETFESIFLVLYTIEMGFKIIGLTFILGPDPYILDVWNQLDFFIVMSSYLTIILEAGTEETSNVDQPGPEESTTSFKVSGLRVFRVLRPLKTISSIKGLKVLIVAVISALPLLKDTITILVFFFLIFAIATTQMFNGMLKQRCIAVQTGQVHPDDIICNPNKDTCPGGYFCAKGGANPNYGVTNFDNINYAFLAVFQCVTLEGWSEIQRDMQISYTSVIYVMFMPMVLLGAFFLLNLTLAVINSKFTESHNAQQELDRIELREKEIGALGNNDDVEEASGIKDDLSITQFITARIYAKKMIEFLRMRQAIKRIEAERKAKMLRQQKEQRLASRSIDGKRAVPRTPNGGNSPGRRAPSSLTGQGSFPGTPAASNGFQNHTIKPLGQTIIQEDIMGEHRDVDSDKDQDKLDKDINDFLLKAKVDLQRQGHNAMDFKVPRITGTAQKKNGAHAALLSPTNVQTQDGAPTMKGNIQPIKKGQQTLAAGFQSEFAKRLAEEFDIDNVIEKADQKDKASDVGDLDSMASFQLSVNKYNYEINSQSQSSQRYGPEDSGAPVLNEDVLGIPGVGQGDEEGLITSDSDFEAAANEAGHGPMQMSQTAAMNIGSMSGEIGPLGGPALGAKKHISRAFKKMLSLNYQIGTTPRDPQNDRSIDGGSTKYEGKSMAQQVDFDVMSANSAFEIESKYKKKTAMRKNINKIYKEDDIQQNALQELFEGQTDINSGLGVNGTTNKNDARTIEEYVSTKKPLDPYREMDPLTHKVEIDGNLAYAGTSQADVFHQRQVDKDKMAQHKINPFIKLPKDLRTPMQDDHEHKQFVKNVWAPHQQKFVYKVQLETTEEDSVSQNEDQIQEQEQPFYTPTRINYEKQTKQIYTKEVAKRADIMITSTLSMSLFPKDKRQIEHEEYHRANMTKKQIRDYVDEHCAFKALVKQNDHQSQKIRDKDKDLRDNYVKSFLHRAQFQSKTLTKFKKNVTKLNMNKKQVIVKHKDIIRQEKLKHQQNIRASTKRGLPTFDMNDAAKLLLGEYHEEDEEDAELTAAMQNTRTLKIKTYAEFKHEEQVEKFELQLKHLLDQDDQEDEHQDDEVPSHLKREFALPKKLLTNEIDFLAIRKFDASHKKIKPMWSGQDVLPTQLDNYKSTWIIDQINYHRVWPVGFAGIVKRSRFTLRLFAKSDFYDNFFTFFVALNTITLSMGAYGISAQREEFLDVTNVYFTWIFIAEMVLKQIAIGMPKYLADKMNWLDGFIVLSSIFEMVFAAIMGGDSVQGLSTLRLLRAVRVFRILRLLRQLESMQTIITVMAKSYMSFVYITALMFLFIIIFSLLGMQTFAGYWKEDPEGVPANNYDTFGYAFFTIFQVLTMENWQSVLFVSMRNNETLVQNIQSPLILIMWIWIGNFILLNLFLAILLDSFLEDEDGLSEEELEAIETKKQKKKAHKKAMLLRKIVNMDTFEIKKMNEVKPSNWYFGQAKGEEEEDLEDLDEDQIVQIFKDLKVIKKDKHEIKNVPMFVGIHCESSFFIFSKQNLIRVGCYKLIKHPLWETIVLGLISLSSLKLFYDTFFVQETEETMRFQVAQIIDVAFNWLFIFEMGTKLVALGLCMDEGSYLRDTWNQMDFFIVTASIFDMALQGKDLKVLKILRMLRTLRPLRFLTHNVGLKMIVNALIGSVSGIVNVGLVIGVVFLMFGIFGVNLYSGKFFYCSLEPYSLSTQKDCEYAGGSWELYDHNFDAIGRSWLTFFIIASLEGWPDIFVQAVESTEQAQGPQLDKSPLKAMVLIITFIFIGSFFFLNFFIGVLFMKFNKAQEEERKGYTQKDLSWMDIQRLILSAEPDYETTNVPESPFRLKFHTLVSSPQFEALIMCFILLNMVQMALLYEGAPTEVTLALDISNYVFAVIFLIEAILKFIAYGSTYFGNAWNKFDFFVVSASIFDFLLEQMNFEGGGFLKVGPQIARVMRVLRVTRILRLAGKAQGLQAILQTIMFSIPALANVSILLFLIYFMMSVFANFQFNNIIEGEALDPDFKNFRNGQAAFVLLFALSTGEDWNKAMFDCSRSKEWGCIENINCGSFAAFIFFPALIVIVSYVMLNLFILVIIQQFDQYYLPAENILGQFKVDQVSFMLIWKEFTQERYNCFKIKEKQLTKFFRKLGEISESLGFHKDQYDDGELKKNLLKMAIKSDNGYIFFNEMLYRCMRRKYGQMKINKQMQIFELRTQYQIYMMTLSTQNKSSAMLSNEDIFNSLIKKENGVNPFLTVMNFKISFKTWLKVAKVQLQQLNEGDAYIQEPDEANKRTVAVDIEVEELMEYSSEEELEHSLTMRSGTMSKSMSGSDEWSSPGRSGKGKMKDHMAIFEKRMQQKLLQSQKFKQSQELGSSLVSPRQVPNNHASTIKVQPINLSQLQKNVEQSNKKKQQRISAKQLSAQQEYEGQLGVE